MLKAQGSRLILLLKPYMKLSNSEPQNSTITNRRISKGGFATLILFYKKIEKYLLSTFDIRYSLFDIRFLKFLISIRLDAAGRRPH